MRAKLFSSITFFIASALFFMGCGPKGEKREIKKMSIVLTSEGPLYEGSNTATYDWKVDFKELLNETPQRINDVKFTSVKVTLDSDTLNSMVSNLVLQMTSGKLDMLKIAFLEKLNAGDASAFTIADKQKKFDEYFNQEKLTFVLDYDLKAEEWNDNLNFNFEFDLEIFADF
jgi:hypothetical protein